MIISNTSLEALRECRYEKNDALGAMVSDNLYLSVVATNACQCSCPYCINSLTDKALSLPYEKATANIGKAVAQLGIKEAVILGGEPTLYPRLIDLIGFLKNECGLRRVGFTTNGIRLTDHEYLVRLIETGVDFINISHHRHGEFITFKQLSEIRRVFQRHARDGQKMRINTNVWRGNHDKLDTLIPFLSDISSCCDEIRVSNIIRKDEFSVNPDAVDRAEGMYMTDEAYEVLFNELLRHYEHRYTIIHNPAALGFVHYYLIPAPVPIIINWNINSRVSNQVCENDPETREIHTVKCLVSGDISLSWNLGNKIEL